MMEKSGESTVDKRQRERERERWTYNKVYSGSSWYFFQRKIDTRVGSGDRSTLKKTGTKRFVSINTGGGQGRGSHCVVNRMVVGHEFFSLSRLSLCVRVFVCAQSDFVVKHPRIGSLLALPTAFTDNCRKCIENCRDAKRASQTASSIHASASCMTSTSRATRVTTTRPSTTKHLPNTTNTGTDQFAGSLQGERNKRQKEVHDELHEPATDGVIDNDETNDTPPGHPDSPPTEPRGTNACVARQGRPSATARHGKRGDCGRCRAQGIRQDTVAVGVAQPCHDIFNINDRNRTSPL